MSAEFVFSFDKLSLDLTDISGPVEGREWSVKSGDNLLFIGSDRDIKVDLPDNSVIDVRLTIKKRDHKSGLRFKAKWDNPICNLDPLTFQAKWDNPICNLDPISHQAKWDSPICNLDPVSHQAKWDNPICNLDVYGIGDAYGGGYIFHVLQPSDHGYEVGKHKVLIAAEDQFFGHVFSTEMIWVGVVDVGLPAGIGYGKSNTEAMLSKLMSSAAHTVEAYNHGGYTDWFLPSSGEMAQLIYVRSQIPIPFHDTPNNDNYYLSSTETSSNSYRAVGLRNNTITQNFRQKNMGPQILRPIRMEEFDI